jgi:hypothetical protein
MSALPGVSSSEPIAAVDSDKVADNSDTEEATGTTYLYGVPPGSYYLEAAVTDCKSWTVELLPQ